MKKQTLAVGLLVLLLSLIVLPYASGNTPDVRQPIYDGPELDYQPSIIRQMNGDLMIVYERMSPGDYFGDMLVTFSSDEGTSWTTPQLIIDSPLNERHPSLLQLNTNSYVLFYLKDETGGGAYRLYRATSSDGTTWTEQGVLDLGWPSPGEINPNVILEADGTLTMSYQRSGSGYLAQSTDDGVTWDQNQTLVNDSARLPRLAKRESDGLYIVSYQKGIGGNNMGIFAKVSYDPYDWDVDEIPLSNNLDSHDSQPIVLEDGTLLVVYAKRPVYLYDIHYRTSCDGVSWVPEVQVTDDSGVYDTQPHPLQQGILGHVILSWSHQDSVDPYVDHDVWVETDLLLAPNLESSYKKVEPAYVHPGEILTYTLALVNAGPGPTPAQLTDAIPNDTIYVPGSVWASSGDYGYDATNDAITWAGGISLCGPISVTFLVETAPYLGDGEVITNTAWLTDALLTAYPLVATATVRLCDPAEIVSVTKDIDGCTVAFGAELQGTAPFSYSWDFGVFGDSGAPTPTVDFGASGTYPYTLTVFNCAGQGDYSDTYTGEAMVSCCEPVHHADFDWVPVTPSVGEQVVFTGWTEDKWFNSGDLNYASLGRAPTPPITYTWTLGDGTAAEGVVVTHTYAAAGDYLVSMTATNACGSEVASRTLTVVELPCDAVQVTAVTTIVVGCQVSFGAELTGTEPFGYSWDFGVFGSSAAPTPTVDFGGDGTYPYTLTVSNCGEAYSDTYAGEVTVVCSGPCAPVQFVTVSTAIAGCEVTFVPEVTGTVPFDWHWDFGDGMTSTEEIPVHTYAISGTYTVTLEVWNCGGAGYDTHIFLLTVDCAQAWNVYLPIVFKAY
jgi:uncharacterized repeat protein (TIGR01451 family)